MHSWAHIKVDDALVENQARAQVQTQVRSLVRDTPHPWTTVGLTPQPVETLVMDVLQQELDDSVRATPQRVDARYHTAYLKCLRTLCKARNVVPTSLLIRDLTREGENPVAGGGFADIWKGYLHGTQVCLKVLRVFGTEEQRAKVLREFCQEVIVWRQLRHPNVLPFTGVNDELFAPRYCLISPWMVNGNIMSYLETHPEHDRLTSLIQVAEGMKYLHNHNPPIAHADIRGANILVNNDLCCCLADFGLSLFVESRTLDSSSRMSKGSARWLAPEYIDPDVVIDWTFVTARDVYAYGCTIVEIFTGEPPFSDIKNEAAVMLAVIAGRHPFRPRDLSQDGLWSLVTTCLIKYPRQRPSAQQISEVLADRDFLADGWNGWASATTDAQNHSGLTLTNTYSAFDLLTPVQFCHSDNSTGQVSSTPPPIDSRFTDFDDFTSRRRLTTRDSDSDTLTASQTRQSLEFPSRSPSPERTDHVADPTERMSARSTPALSTRRFLPLPKRPSHPFYPLQEPGPHSSSFRFQYIPKLY